jgi:hypothetical protein
MEEGRAGGSRIGTLGKEGRIVGLLKSSVGINPSNKAKPPTLKL